MSETIGEMRITDAGKGWMRVWKGSALIAACPSRGQAEDVARAFQAQEELEVARQKIALLEQTLEGQLCGRVFMGIRAKRG